MDHGIEGIPVLVVGGAGYVGAHTCKALRNAGYFPITFDNLSTGHKDFVRWGPLVRGDIRDWEACRDVIQKYRVVAVLHFAAHAYVGESVIDPQKYYDNNVFGSLGLLQGMLSAGCSYLIFSSTCSIYGSALSVPISETAERNPINPYGRSKLMVERILRDYDSAYGLKSIALRYFNASGADAEGIIGERRDPETHLIPRAMMALLGYVDDFAVFGADFPTPDGTAIRDYVHVTDLASAHVASLERLLNLRVSGAFNLGTGQGHSVREVLAAIERETSMKLPAVCGTRREGDPAVLISSAELAKSEIHFEPKHSGLENIIRTAWAWHRSAHPMRGGLSG